MTAFNPAEDDNVTWAFEIGDEVTHNSNANIGFVVTHRRVVGEGAFSKKVYTLVGVTEYTIHRFDAYEFEIE